MTCSKRIQQIFYQYLFIFTQIDNQQYYKRYILLSLYIYIKMLCIGSLLTETLKIECHLTNFFTISLFMCKHYTPYLCLTYVDELKLCHVFKINEHWMMNKYVDSIDFCLFVAFLNFRIISKITVAVFWDFRNSFYMAIYNWQ